MKKRTYRVKYENKEEYIDLKGYSMNGGIVCLLYPGAGTEENLSGFSICDSKGVIADCKDFKYRWDVLEDNPDKIYYTSSSGNVQTEKNNTNNWIEDIDPLSNEELTEAVADLMYEISSAKLGL